jgi:hypothetical protein
MSRCVMSVTCYSPVMLLRSLGMLLVGLVLLGAAEPAFTCIFVPPRLHQVDASLRQSDRVAPPPPIVVSVDAFRRNGTTCTRVSCVQNSCGNTGTVRIELAPSADDGTPPEALGYRLILVRGELPASLSGSIGVTLAAGRPLLLRPSFDELPSLDVALAAVAVDAAGNESEPTPPFSIRFDGCTLAAVGDRCEDELEPDTDLSEVFEEQLGLRAEADAPVARGDGGCSIVEPSSSSGWVVLTNLLLVGWASSLRRRGRGTTGYSQPWG